MLQIQFLTFDGVPTVSRPLGNEPVYIGRAGTNDVVLDARSISGRHASVWTVRGDLYVEDLGSRNGTFRANGTRIRGPTRIPAGERIRLGTEIQLVVEGTLAGRNEPVMVALANGAGAFPVSRNRFLFGPEASADVIATESVAILLHADGDLWLVRDDAEGPLDFEEPFEVDGTSYVVRGSAMSVSATWDADHERHPYRVVTTLNGALGPEATVVHEHTGASHSIAGANRAVLLHVLTQKLEADRTAQVPSPTAGWVADEVVASAIWGRGGAGKNLNVLVSRIRSELKGAGFNPWFIEKRRGSTRLNLNLGAS